MKLNKEEKQLQKEIENDEWKPVSAAKKKKVVAELKQAAKATMLKDIRMNIRMNSKDVEKLKTIALQEGLPYQTLVSSILHKYVTGKIEEVNN